jgi:hypothetical protein
MGSKMSECPRVDRRGKEEAEYNVMDTGVTTHGAQPQPDFAVQAWKITSLSSRGVLTLPWPYTDTRGGEREGGMRRITYWK